MCDLTEALELHAATQPAPILSDEEIEHLFYYYERFDFKNRWYFDYYAHDPVGCWEIYAHERWGKNG